MTDDPNNMSLRSPTSSWWRFSIRELLLLTAAVAAFLAWAGLLFQRSRPYEPTRIPDLVGNFQNVRTICESLGHRTSSFMSGGGGGSNMHETTRTHDCRIDLPANLRGEFMTAYRQHVLGVLEREADKVWGAGTTSGYGGLSAFDLEYSKGNTRGHVIVRSAAGGEDLTLLVLIHEHDTKP